MQKSNFINFLHVHFDVYRELIAQSFKRAI